MRRAKGRRPQQVPPHGNTIALGSTTHVGKTRSANQDAYASLLSPNSPPGTDALLVVADGMGGHLAGDVASTMAIQGLLKRLASQRTEDATILPPEGYQARLAQIVQQVNAEVFQAAAKPEMRGMGTTFTMALVMGTAAVIAHVGDSRAYLLSKGKLQQLTQDHSWVAEQVAAGILTPEEARGHPQRNILTRALGTSPQVQVDTARVALEEGDILLLCSDGLHSLVADEELAQVAASEEPQQACQTLVERANALGGHDNITVVIARLGHLDLERAPAGRPDRSREAATVRLTSGAGSARAVQKRSGKAILLRALWAPPQLLLWVVARFLLLLGRLLLRALNFGRPPKELPGKPPQRRRQGPKG